MGPPWCGDVKGASPGPCAQSDRSGGGPQRPKHAELQHRLKILPRCPMLGESAVGHAKPMDLARREALSGGGHNAAEFSEVGTFRSDPNSDSVGLGYYR